MMRTSLSVASFVVCVCLTAVSCKGAAPPESSPVQHAEEIITFAKEPVQPFATSAAQGCRCAKLTGEFFTAGCGCYPSDCAKVCEDNFGYNVGFAFNAQCAIFSCGAQTETTFNVRLYPVDTKNGDPAQCLGGGQGAKLGDWTPPIQIRADGHQGGCSQSFYITDPRGLLQGLELSVDQEQTPGGDPWQCATHDWGLGKRPIPIVPPAPSGGWSHPLWIDLDERPGGCTQTYSITGSNKRIALEIRHFPVGNDNGLQCGTTHTTASTAFRVENGKPVTLTIDTNYQYACGQQFRLITIG